MQRAHAEQVAAKRWKIPENHIAIPDIYGNGWIGPESRTRERVSGIKREYDVALGEALQGPIASLMYRVSGDGGAFKGAAVDQIFMSVGGIPAGNSKVFPRKIEMEPLRFVANSQGGSKESATKEATLPWFKAIPPGFNYLADTKVWRTTPKNLPEKMLMNAAMNGAGEPIIGTGTDKPLGDPRLTGYNITKYSISIDYTTPLGGSTNAVMHYLKNNAVGTLFDFKFDDRSIREPKLTPERNTSVYSKKETNK